MKRSATKRFSLKGGGIMIIIILLLSLILFYHNWISGIIGLVLCGAMGYYIIWSERQRSREIDIYMGKLSFNMDLATKNAILTVPMPVVVTDVEGSIIWYNANFERITKEENLIGDNLGKYMPSLNFGSILENPKNLDEIKLKGHTYRVTYSPVQMEKEIDEAKVLLFFYWQDITDQILVEEKYKKEQLVLAHIYVDNYDEVLANTEASERPMVIAEIDGRLGRWASNLNAGWQKYDKDRFIMIADFDILTKLEANKFDILDDIRGIDTGSKMYPTLSIGVGVESKGPAHSAECAKTALDMALGRGGDQAVVKRGTKLYFYGGKTKAVERRTKVKSRVMAGILRELMEQSAGVLIMSHQLPDLDSLGSALGIYRCGRHIDKRSHIILEESNPSVHYLIDEIKEREEYEDLFVSHKDARTMIEEGFLLVVVDTHRPSFTEVPELLDIAERIAVIDHHRRSTESIENPTLAYLEPYASSASELVSEIVQYFDEGIRLNSLEADALLVGITMDTKSFTFKTGVRTFEAASYLKRSGADPTRARQFFKDDMETYIARAETVKNARILLPGIAASVCPPGVRSPALIAAQAADNLLTIRGIYASFVLAQAEDEVIISGRSLGNINVQLILEKLGGGGHMTIAGAQLTGVTLDEAQTRIQKAVEEYLNEEGESK